MLKTEAELEPEDQKAIEDTLKETKNWLILGLKQGRDWLPKAAKNLSQLTEGIAPEDVGEVQASIMKRMQFLFPELSAESLAVVRGAKLLFVGGKGGVGKTTVSAAVAVRLARAHPTQRLLLLSTDPAHSIADVLDLATDTEIDDAPKSMRGGPANLFVRELDAARALAARRADLEHALDEIAASLGAASIGGGARSADLMELAPPGIDELFGILEVVKLTRPAGAGGPAGGYDLIVVDTAPTGHALRLLSAGDGARYGCKC
jgi:arsenite-transporting ATPase